MGYRDFIGKGSETSMRPEQLNRRRPVPNNGMYRDNDPNNRDRRQCFGEGDEMIQTEEGRLWHDKYLSVCAELATVRGAMKADDERLLDAAQKAGILYTDCDTPDGLADEILGLRAELAAMNIWTSVEKRLPEDGDYLLFVGEDAPNSSKTAIELSTYSSEYGWDTYGIPLYYRPLPEPPKAKGE
jgi:hypothetical protein